MSYEEFDPARAKAKDPSKLWGRADLIAEPKMNGWRFLMHFGIEMPRVYLTGRRVSQRTGFLSEKGMNVPTVWPEKITQRYTVIDGEIMPPALHGFRDIAGIMNSDVETARGRIAEIGSPTYHAFDVLFCDGEDVREMCQIERRGILERLIPTLDNHRIQIVPQMPPLREAFDAVVARGGEGVVLKDLAAPYGEGWIKVKREHTLDVIVTGFTDARHGRTGKYVGLIGAIVVSVYTSSGELIEVGQVSGMTDEERVHISQNKGLWLGQVIEIVAQGWGKDRLSHPRYGRPRPDAERRACTFSKMMSDLGTQEETCRDEEDPKQPDLFR